MSVKIYVIRKSRDVLGLTRILTIDEDSLFPFNVFYFFFDVYQESFEL